MSAYHELRAAQDEISCLTHKLNEVIDRLDEFRQVAYQLADANHRRLNHGRPATQEQLDATIMTMIRVNRRAKQKGGADAHRKG